MLLLIFLNLFIKAQKARTGVVLEILVHLKQEVVCNGEILPRDHKKNAHVHDVDSDAE